MRMSVRYAIDYDRGAIIEWKADGTRVHRYVDSQQWLDDHGKPVEHQQLHSQETK